MEEKQTPRNRRPVKVKDIDRELVFRLACMQCTLQEIADVVGVGHETVRKHFGDLIEQGKNVGKKSLRRAQWEKALNGSDRMLVWLGKQYLSQKDAPEGGDENQPLPWED